MLAKPCTQVLFLQAVREIHTHASAVSVWNTVQAVPEQHANAASGACERALVLPEKSDSGKKKYAGSIKAFPTCTLGQQL